MNILKIEVPDMNDSFINVSLDRTMYQLRFTWNDTAGFWTVGVYTDLRVPIIQAIKIIPNFPLNLQYAYNSSPNGALCAYSKLKKIGRYDFVAGKATFAFVPVEQ